MPQEQDIPAFLCTPPPPPPPGLIALSQSLPGANNFGDTSDKDSHKAQCIREEKDQKTQLDEENCSQLLGVSGHTSPPHGSTESFPT